MKALTKLPAGPLFVMLFGLLFFAIGAGSTFLQRIREQRGIEVQGTVIRLHESVDSDGSTYAPVVRFKTNSGQDVEFVTSYYSSPPVYDVGQSVVVVYPSETPEKAVIKGDGQLFHIIYMLAGGVVAGFGSYWMYTSLRDMSLTSLEA